MLVEFFNDRLDYVFFLCGQTFVLLAAICLILRLKASTCETPISSLAWGWLGLFGLMQGIANWLDLFTLNRNDTAPVEVLRLCLLAASYCFLLEFHRASQSTPTARIAGRLIYIPLIALTALGGWSGLNGLNAVCRYTLGLVSGSLAFLTLLRASTVCSRSRRSLLAAAIGMGIYTPTVGILVPPAAFVPASLVNQDSFIAFTGFPLQLLAGLMALLIAAALWHCQLVSGHTTQDADDLVLKKNTRFACAFTLAMGAVLTGGWVLTEYAGMERAAEQRINAMRQATLLAGAIDPDGITDLHSGSPDLSRKSRLALCRKLIRIQEGNPHIRRIYVFRPGERTPSLALESIRGSLVTGASPRRQSTDTFQTACDAFDTDRATAVGPYDDLSEYLVAGFAPLHNPTTQRRVGVLGLEICTHEWKRTIAAHRLIPIIITLLIAQALTLLLLVRQRMQDVAERVAGSERQYRSMFEDNAAAVMLIDPVTGDIVDANVAACSYYGFSHEQFTRLNITEIQPMPKEQWAELIAGSRSGVGKQFGTCHRLASGVVRDVECYFTWLSFRGAPRIHAIVVDVTERKRAEEALQESNAMLRGALRREKQVSTQLEAAMEQLRTAMEAAKAATQSKSEFLANMSHEIRTPMTAIVGFADALLDPDQSEADRLDAVRTIQRNSEYLLSIINDILDLSKIEAGKMAIEHIPCSPCQVVAEVVSLMKVRADAKGLAFNVEYLGAVPEQIHTDPTRLRQILINLIGNAIKFTEVGGVRLIARFVNETKPMMQFDVLDTGIGMTPGQMSAVFRPFTQADTSTTRQFGGTGLGLSISKRLAEMLGGDISILNSEVGMGTCFRVSVETGPLDGVEMIDDPTDVTMLAAEKPKEANLSSDALDCRVLLAEDGPDNQRLIAHVLRKAGAEVTIVENGKLALDNALDAHEQGIAFDVILMDMQMPVMDGYEATALLRQKGYSGPIIALTAHAMTGDREKCIRAGCDDFATKPIDRKKLIATIRSILQRSGLSSDPAADNLRPVATTD